jgi:hypothetical protein
MNNQGVVYDVDIVLCIDQTGSMEPIMNQVKERALSFHKDFRRELESMDKNVDTLRVRVIGFRDYQYNDYPPMEISEFFELPDKESQFSSFANNLEAAGGGDEPESGLEALAFAIKSDWNTRSVKKRHIIVIWTDTSFHPLGTGRGSEKEYVDYPSSDLPKNMDELTDWWDGQSGRMDFNAKRLLIFAPDTEGWSEICTHWEKAIHVPTVAGEGLADKSYVEILNAIAKSV